MKRGWPRSLIGALLLLGAGHAAVSAAETSPPLERHVCSDFDSQIWAQSVYDARPGANPGISTDARRNACPDLPTGFAPARWTSYIPEGAIEARFVRVVDGDTVELEVDGRVETVQLILADAPDLADPQRPEECFAGRSAAFLTELLTGYGGSILLERDVSDRDRYGRLRRGLAANRAPSPAKPPAPGLAPLVP